MAGVPEAEALAASAVAEDVPAAVAPAAAGDESMNPKAFINQLDDAVILKAIADAEARSSGEIRIYVSRHVAKDVLAEAREAFTRLGMDKTALRNGVLLYFVPKSQQFAVIGDEAIHARCGQEFWAGISATISERFKAGGFTDGVLTGITTVGELLA